MELLIDNVSKQYRKGVWGQRDFTLRLEPGVLGLLGPNGAGKSTLMRMIATIATPSSGAIYWNGTDIARQPDDLRRVLGYLPQDFGVYPNLSAVEFLTYIAAVKGLHVMTVRHLIEALSQDGLATLTQAPLGMGSERASNRTSGLVSRKHWCATPDVTTQPRRNTKINICGVKVH